ncbi:MAG: lytic transglycosylase domain-containing protein [Chloroflexota bacterium]
MPRARTSYPANRQTAASEPGSGCLSGFMLPPLAVLFVGLLLAFFAGGVDTPVQAGDPPPLVTPAAATTTGLSPLFRPEVRYWGDSIQRWAAASGLDPNLVAVVMQIESCGDPRALSRSGAMGLFQVMPFHFHAGDNPYTPDTNALRGLAYLKRSLETANGDPRLALAGYNGGIGVIARAESLWSAQTARYVYFGGPIYEDARSGAAASPMLEEWYHRYGVSLCRQAAQRLGLPQ